MHMDLGEVLCKALIVLSPCRYNSGLLSVYCMADVVHCFVFM